jgi:hypothetical protein
VAATLRGAMARITRPAFVDERIQLNNAGQVELNPAASGVQCVPQTVQRRPARMSWARLLKRVFDIDMQRCPNCSARELKIIGAILERSVIERILSYLGLDPQPPPKDGASEAGPRFAACAAYAVGYLSLRLPCGRGGAARCVGKTPPT